MSPTTKKISNLLLSNLQVHHLDIIDDSAKHQNHKKDSSGGHYTMILISDDFINLNLLTRRKKVYGILDTLMKIEIHALSMRLMTIEEFENS
tara:strand:- start:24 stop:299 length:276 start_codon:yes stop_codon:yes gene_type:complete